MHSSTLKPPDNRGHRRTGVLDRKISGNPTNQALAAIDNSIELNLIKNGDRNEGLVGIAECAHDPQGGRGRGLSGSFLAP
jgi:hypothetical protein